MPSVRRSIESICPICGNAFKKPWGQKGPTCGQTCRKELTKRKVQEDEERANKMKGKLINNPCRNCGKPTGYNYFFCPSCFGRTNDDPIRYTTHLTY